MSILAIEKEALELPIQERASLRSACWRALMSKVGWAVL